jgi:hypothetical protein
MHPSEELNVAQAEAVTITGILAGLTQSNETEEC